MKNKLLKFIRRIEMPAFFTIAIVITIALLKQGDYVGAIAMMFIWVPMLFAQFAGFQNKPGGEAE